MVIYVCVTANFIVKVRVSEIEQDGLVHTVQTLNMHARRPSHGLSVLLPRPETLVTFGYRPKLHQDEGISSF